MKKSLQRIAFGLSIIAASTGVTQAMQAPVTGSMVSSTTVDPATHSIMKVARPLKTGTPPTEIDLASEGVDLSKIFVMDGESIIRGVIPETQQVSFLEMLANPTLAIAKFNEFLDNSYFLRENDEVWLKTKETAFLHFLSEKSRLSSDIIDSIPVISLISRMIHSNPHVVYCHDGISSLWKKGSEMIIKSLETNFSANTVAMVLNMNTLFPFVQAYFNEFRISYIKERSEYREKLRAVANAAIIEDVKYRESIVSLLAAFESKKITNSEFKAIFVNKGLGTGITNEHFFVVSLPPLDESVTLPLYTLPSLLKDGKYEDGELSKYEWENQYRHAIYHEFGHIIASLLFNEHFGAEERQSLMQLDHEVSKFWKDLLFGEWFFKANVGRLIDPSTPSEKLEETKRKIIEDAKLIQHGLWSNRSEIFQISGLYFHNGLTVVNKLSDLNYAISNTIPFRWWHNILVSEAETDQRDLSRYIVSLLKYSLPEPIVKELFFFHETSYDSYREAVLAKQK